VAVVVAEAPAVTMRLIPGKQLGVGPDAMLDSSCTVLYTGYQVHVMGATVALASGAAEDTTPAAHTIPGARPLLLPTDVSIVVADATVPRTPRHTRLGATGIPTSWSSRSHLGVVSVRVDVVVHAAADPRRRACAASGGLCDSGRRCAGGGRASWAALAGPLARAAGAPSHRRRHRRGCDGPSTAPWHRRAGECRSAGMQVEGAEVTLTPSGEGGGGGGAHEAAVQALEARWTDAAEGSRRVLSTARVRLLGQRLQPRQGRRGVNAVVSDRGRRSNSSGSSTATGTGGAGSTHVVSGWTGGEHDDLAALATLLRPTAVALASAPVELVIDDEMVAWCATLMQAAPPSEASASPAAPHPVTTPSSAGAMPVADAARGDALALGWLAAAAVHVHLDGGRISLRGASGLTAVHVALPTVVARSLEAAQTGLVSVDAAGAHAEGLSDPWTGPLHARLPWRRAPTAPGSEPPPQAIRVAVRWRGITVHTPAGTAVPDRTLCPAPDLCTPPFKLEAAGFAECDTLVVVAPTSLTATLDWPGSRAEPPTERDREREGGRYTQI
jgi:hypothetical protein